jgi:hypothetical protein
LCQEPSFTPIFKFLERKREAKGRMHSTAWGNEPLKHPDVPISCLFHLYDSHVTLRQSC